MKMFVSRQKAMGEEEVRKFIKEVRESELETQQGLLLSGGVGGQTLYPIYNDKIGDTTYVVMVPSVAILFPLYWNENLQLVIKSPQKEETRLVKYIEIFAQLTALGLHPTRMNRYLDFLREISRLPENQPPSIMTRP